MFIKKRFLIVICIFKAVSVLGQINVTVNQLNILNQSAPLEPSSIGILTLTCAPEEAEKMINIVAKNRTEEKFWLVRNLYLPFGPEVTSPQSFSIRFDFKWLGYESGASISEIDLYLHRSEKILHEIPNGEFDLNVQITAADQNCHGVSCSLPPPPPLSEPCNFFPEYSADDIFFNSGYSGDNFPNIDLYDDRYPDTDQYAGDALACGPAACANIFKWLEWITPQIQIPDSQRAVMVSLGEAMQRERSEGVSIDQLLRGNLDYLHTCSLPVQIRFQSETVNNNLYDLTQSRFALNENSTAFPNWEWIVERFNAGDALAVVFYWWDREKWLGQAAALTGILETAGGVKTIFIQFDLDQSRQGGLVQEWIGLCPDSFGRLRFRWPETSQSGIPGPWVPSYIGDAIAYTYDPSAVPVELIYFNAICNNYVFLTWKTCSERNNYGFEIFRNNKKLAFIPGRGTDSSEYEYCYIDSSFVNDLVKYELYQIDFGGSRYLLTTTIAKRSVAEYHLSNNYPNPFNAQTQFNASFPESGKVIIDVFNVKGERIKQVFSDILPAGEFSFKINLSDQASGVYFCCLRWREHLLQKKLLLMK
ncbi:T9SS type A sorting domain-containing protein [candidate division KSB1 bacterium]|nr:T9SS type A sorting domain-containing protein [candidate division KSB1 bacterium]